MLLTYRMAKGLADCYWLSWHMEVAILQGTICKVFSCVYRIKCVQFCCDLDAIFVRFYQNKHGSSALMNAT